MAEKRKYTRKPAERKDVTTYAIGCVLRHTSESYDAYRQTLYPDAPPTDYTHIMSAEHGYHLLNRNLPISFTFTQSASAADYEADPTLPMVPPTMVAWMGPPATLVLTNHDDVTVYTQDLPKYAKFMKKNFIGKIPAPFSHMAIHVAAGYRPCRVQFRYNDEALEEEAEAIAADAALAVTTKRRHLSLGAQLEADEDGKDITITTSNGSIKVHKFLLCLYSDIYKQRFANGDWQHQNVITQDADSIEAWELIVATMYDHPVPSRILQQPALVESLKIAHRDNLVKYAALALARLALISLDTNNVVPILEVAGIYHRETLVHAENRATADAILSKCFKHIFAHVIHKATSEWIIAYAATLHNDPELAAYADSLLIMA